MNASSLPLSCPCRVRLVAPSSPRKGFRSPLQSDPSGRIYTPLSRSALFPCFCFSPPSRLPHGVSSSCLAAAPSKTQRPFSNVVPLSVEPVSPSKPRWKLCCSVLLFVRGGVSHLLILQCACVCESVRLAFLVMFVSTKEI